MKPITSRVPHMGTTKKKKKGIKMSHHLYKGKRDLNVTLRNPGKDFERETERERSVEMDEVPPKPCEGLCGPTMSSAKSISVVI